MNIYKKLIIASASLAVLAAPVLGLAINIPPQPVGNNALNVTSIVNSIFGFIWPVIIGIIIILFIIAGFEFITAQGDSAKIGKARQFVIWGIVGIVVVLLAFSMVSIIQNSLGIF
jgi:hypothetical protein